MEITRFITGPLATNTYLLTDEKKRTHYLIDPGAFGDKNKKLLSHLKYELSFILITHGHIDHIAGIPFFKKHYPSARVVMSKTDMPLYLKAETQSAMFGLPHPENMPEPDILLKNETEFDQFKILYTPGHSQGSVCFYHESSEVLFAGDVIFRESIGRTDFLGGSFEDLMYSIKQKIFILPENTMLLPGHGEPTDIGYEKSHNPFVV